MQKNKFVFNNSELISFVKERIDKQESDYLKTFSYDVSDVYLTDHITECKRRILYRVCGTKIDNLDFKHRYLFDNRNFLVNKWIGILGKTEDVSIIGEKVRIGESISNLFGIIDLVAKVKNTNVAFMFYSLSDSDFNVVKDNGVNRKDVIDIMLKMWMIKVNNGIILYESSDLNYLMFNVKPYDRIIKSVYKICQGLNNHKIKGILIDRSYDKISQECLSCEYKNKCWDKEV